MESKERVERGENSHTCLVELVLKQTWLTTVSRENLIDMYSRVRMTHPSYFFSNFLSVVYT